MADQARYFGVSFSNLRKALYLLYFGVDGGACNSFDSPKYKYIIPMQGNFENPVDFKSKDTYIQYWIESDSSLVRDGYEQQGEDSWNVQKCVASVLLRFVGRDAEDWARAFRHMCLRKDVGEIWSGVCNAEKLPYTSPIVPRKIYNSGMNASVAFDIRFKLYYDECIATGWKPLEGVCFDVIGDMTVSGDVPLESGRGGLDDAQGVD